MGLNLEYISGQTPLDEDEINGLLIPAIATRSELDEFEQQNIEDAVQWLLTRSFRPEVILSQVFVRNLHKQMYGNVWDWAGDFRKTDKNLGIDKWQIPTALKTLLDDTLFWVNNNTFPPDEIAVRFKHRIVSIHCFPNGNGRHSRLMADVIIEKIFKLTVFSWGAADLVYQSDTRMAYLQAIRKADVGDIIPLITFSRT